MRMPDSIVASGGTSATRVESMPVRPVSPELHAVNLNSKMQM